MRGSSRVGALMASEALTGAPRDPDAAAFLVLAVADPGRLVLGVDHHHVAHVDGRLLRDDPALLGAALAGADPGVLLHPAEAFHQHPLELRVGGDDSALRALVLAGQHEDGVALLHLHRRRLAVLGVSHGHNTSGASEMIRMNRLSRSSRPTGPKMRVPRGSPLSRMITAAFSSKRMWEPSGRRRSLTVRTMTALTTSPFFTPAPGSASFTVATMMSPMPAYRRPEPPSTRMHSSSLAPVLSATRSLLSC